jgi:hypothetical protein
VLCPGGVGAVLDAAGDGVAEPFGGCADRDQPDEYTGGEAAGYDERSDPLLARGPRARAPQQDQTCNPGTDGWLIPGRHAGQHISADRLQQRLKRYGLVRSRDGRHAALLALAARLPAPILAERIGIHQSRAAAWVRMAGKTYSDYVAIRNREEHLTVTSDPNGASEQPPR